MGFVPEQIFLEHVKKGDCEAVRGYFDLLFWKNIEFVPAWDCLKAALENEDRPMMRLLITRGAAPDKTVSLPEDQLLLLRRCGLPVSGMAMEKKPEAPVQDMKQAVETIPQEWKTVLRAVQNQGGGEAVIAGGALRDLFNQRPVKDVDIFLKARGGEKKSKVLLQMAFSETGFQIVQQTICSAPYIQVTDAFPAPKVIKTDESRASGGNIEESWTIVAGPARTHYNIIFVDGDIRKRGADDFGRGVIEGFDFSLCQIAYDGKEIISTPGYRQDVAGRKIVLNKENLTTREHLERIVKKYPDFELCADSKRLLGKIEIGEVMPDGTVYAGLSPDTGRAMYAASVDVPLSMNFNEAGKYAKKTDIHGHKDWRVPTKAELNVLYQNREKGALKGTFNAKGCYWSSTSSIVFKCYQNFDDGYQGVDSGPFHFFSVRPVRLEPKP